MFIRGIKKALENIVFSRACGGRNRTRTCDPIDVNDVLSPCGRNYTLLHIHNGFRVYMFFTLCIRNGLSIGFSIRNDDFRCFIPNSIKDFPSFSSETAMAFCFDSSSRMKF